MTDARVERLADVLVEYSTEVSKNDLVVIKGAAVAEPLLLAIYRRCLEVGAFPRIQASLPAAEPLFYELAQDHQLDHVWPTDKWVYENVDVSFNILSDVNTRQLTRIDHAKQARSARARRPLLDAFFKRSAAGEVRWNITLWPTHAYAMDAEMSLAQYEDFFFGACLVDARDPVSEWRKVAERHAELIKWMDGRSEILIEGEGTDILLDVSGRTWMPADGKENFPDGEIFSAPVETKTRGYVSFQFPAIYGGVAVEGIRLEFENGRVVDATADRNEDFLIKSLDTDAGARVLGEVGIGTNYGITDFTGEILLDEKIGGTIHLALGASFPECGGINESAIHWDMVCDLRRGGRITVDGDLLMEDGKLLV